MARFDNEAKRLTAAPLRQHTSKNGLTFLLGANSGENDRHALDFALKIVVLKVRGLVWPGLTALSGKYRINELVELLESEKLCV